VKTTIRLLGLALVLLGCSAPDAMDVPARLPSSYVDGAAPPPPEQPELAPLVKKLADKITEPDVVALALAKNPDLNIARQERLASRARLYQASVYPYNPSLYVGFDQLPVTDHHPKEGKGPYVGQAQYGILQQLEFPTKRGHRVDLFEAQVRGADADFESKERDTRTNVRTAFVDILAAQERLAVADKNHEIAVRLHEAATARVAASAAPSIEETKADADELKARNDAKAAERDVKIAKAQLAGVLGDPSLAIGALDGALALDGPELAFQGAKPVDRNPALISKGHAVDAAEANLAVQRTSAYPDPSLQFYYERNRGDTDSLAANLSIPLPIFDSNRGAIRDAELSVEKARSDLESTRASLVTQYHQAISSYDTARANAKLIREKTLPATEKALALAEDGWKAGKFRYLDVLDAERSLTSARADYVSALQDLNHAIIQLEALTGKNVEELGK
jgi:cobalt-zinc-cadmium efflux system outer membrane protein